MKTRQRLSSWALAPRGGCTVRRTPRSRDFLPTITLGAAKACARSESGPPHETQPSQRPRKETTMDTHTRQNILADPKEGE